jgi:hypothetical protein
MGVLAAYDDPELASLRLEARATEEAVLKLEDEKVAIEHKLIDYNDRFRRELGGLLERLLDLRRQRMARAAKAGKVQQTEWQEAEKDYQNLKEEHANAYDLPALTEAEEGELKALFRKAAKLCHPDKVAEEHRDEASRLFQQAKEAQAHNDIGRLRELVANLERGAFGSRGADKIGEKAKIRAIIQRLLARRDALQKELETLRASDPFRVMQDVKDWGVYFAQLRRRMEREIELEGTHNA